MGEFEHQFPLPGRTTRRWKGHWRRSRGLARTWRKWWGECWRTWTTRRGTKRTSEPSGAALKYVCPPSLFALTFHKQPRVFEGLEPPPPLHPPTRATPNLLFTVIEQFAVQWCICGTLMVLMVRKASEKSETVPFHNLSFYLMVFFWICRQFRLLTCRRLLFFSSHFSCGRLKLFTLWRSL